MIPLRSNKGHLEQPDTIPDSRLEPLRSPVERVGSTWLIVVIALMAVSSVAPLLPALVEQWLTVADYDYCFVIAAVCLVWLWRCSRATVPANLKPDARFLTALVLVSGIEYVLWQGHSELGAQLLLPPIVWLAIASIAGWAEARKWLAPCAYFYFAIPLWDQFLPMLQQLAIFGAKSSMQMMMIPVTVSGNKVSIPEGTFEVLYGCAGLRYLIVSLALASLTVVINRMSLRTVAVFMALTVVLAVVANWLRIFIVMYAGHVTGMRHYFVSDNHQGLGYAVFAGLLLTIYWLAQRLQPSAAIEAPAAVQQRDIRTNPGSVHLHAIAVVAILMVFGGLNLRADRTAENSVAPQLQPLPVALGQWQGPLPSKSSWQPSYQGASDSRQIAYVSSRGTIEVYLNVYGVQRQGNTELVFYRNTVYAPGSWQLVNTRLLNAVQAGIGIRPLITEQVTNNNQRWIVGHLYVVGGHRTAAGLFAQMMYGLSTIGRAAPAGILAFATGCSTDCVAERELLQDFWAEMGDSLAATIPQSMPLQMR